ncbi:PRP38 family-domain-containing protein [Thelonectria olida]|uniref:Pre-mRNA-splicing factor 38 n=1 Tax=Thelonectria olida TaxID=1576542 RepID=A0A9P9AMP3_9HYPO|nr:PRP38 family-domain-containing protein [Thelonectria olida]
MFYDMLRSPFQHQDRDAAPTITNVTPNRYSSPKSTVAMSRNKADIVYADARRFLDERGSNAALAPNGLNPATIMEKAVKDRIVDSYFYKEQCFALNEADIVDRVVEHVSFIGGTHGTTQKPSPFLCLAFKLLELAPSDAVLQEYLQYGGEEFKYLRALACFYVRLTRQAKDVYTILESFLEDRRKLRRKARAGTTLTFVDEFVDDLLTKDRVCATSLWKMPARETLEDLEILEPRVSPLGDLEDLLEEDDDEEDKEDGTREESGEVPDRDGMDLDRDDRSDSRNRSRTRGGSQSGSRSRSRTP